MGPPTIEPIGLATNDTPPSALFARKPAPEEDNDFNDLDDPPRAAPRRPFAPPIQVPASRRPLAMIDTLSNDVDSDVRLETGVTRRCACNKVFTAHSLKEVACPSCRVV